ncbi:MAG: V-type ATP synthase subunit D [Nanoarchaeota archaeon]|nr:V-type ATP synthase subunit D [Nanoarchaeota archaeon]
MTDVKPTRSELLNLKRKIKLAQTGHKLLKRKRDGLIIEFFGVLKNARTVRKDLAEKFVGSQENLASTIALDGIVEIKSAALALKDMPAIDLDVKNIMGVTVPRIKRQGKPKTLFERGYDVFAPSLRLEKTSQSYETLLSDVIAAAEVETTLRKLLWEIERTKRRVNALEFAVIPKLQKQATFINMRLEEMERETIFRMKRMKAG